MTAKTNGDSLYGEGGAGPDLKMTDLLRSAQRRPLHWPLCCGAGEAGIGPL